MKLKRYVLLDNNAAHKNQIFTDVSIPLGINGFKGAL